MPRDFSELQKSWPVLILSIAFAGCSSGVSFGPEAEARKVAQDRYAKAKALFEERCKKAGIVIKRTVKDVEGIELVKVRQPIPWGGKEYFDPMYPEAAMAGEHRGDYYLKQFLMSEMRVLDRPLERGSLHPPTHQRRIGFATLISGYRNVEYRNGNDGQQYRCKLSLRPHEHSWEGTPLSCEVVAKQNSRFALDYEDLVDPNDRAFWISGTKLKVIDKQSGESIAELTKYVWDPGFGASSTGRWPWAHAGTAVSSVCPKYPERLHGFDSRFFVDIVLQPKQGD